ncbi:hypothetical protein CHS0354_019953 [Potamilus streckersoni]|uniref:Rieske domain-containing protein n=1 Tax=Potamilus streckersoni TaxID=2493646 RepID=A0AAE0VMD1_9BIVA|nr:hypothetical protein CHS0354_019953 [Potamilus streckersoni]
MVLPSLRSTVIGLILTKPSNRLFSSQSRQPLFFRLLTSVNKKSITVLPSAVKSKPEYRISVTSVRNQSSKADNTMAADQIEAVVCGVDELKDGEMREVDVGGEKALLVKQGSEFYAIGAKCTHYGAPLSKGVLCNGRVRCPWHGACFNVKTGDIEEFPGLDSLPKFQVEVSNGKVKIRADKSALATSKRQKAMCKASAVNQKSVVIIGGGPASVSCVETLRQEGFQGKITLVSKDKYLPYDRIKLSKAMDTAPEAIALRNKDFYSSNDITVQTNKEVKSVSASSKSVKFADGSSLKFDSLLIATGGRPRVLPIPGADLKNVYILRTPDDANAIAQNAKGKKVVIIGSSFIGLEVAAFMSGKAQSVDVIARGTEPLENVFGREIGSMLRKMHEEKGVKFHFESGIKEFLGKNGFVSEAVLSNGTKLPADVCILGVGVVPATEFLKDSGIKMTDRGFIPVNQFMQTDQPDIFAAGDIVEFPLFTVGGKDVNIQHWQMAHAHGRNAALNIVGKKHGIKSVPFFWTVMYGKSVRYTGYGPGYDDVVVHGEINAQKFVAFYTKGNEVVAVASMNFDPIVSQAAEMMQAGKKIMKSDVLKDPTAWLGKL